MSISRTLAGPLFGTAAAGLVLYAFGTSLAIRTHQVTDTLHNSSRNLRRLADVDDTQDLLKQWHIAPETEEIAHKLDQLKHRHGGGHESSLAAAFQYSPQATLSDQIKSRWNQYLFDASLAVSSLDMDTIIETTSWAVHKLTGKAYTVKEEIEQHAAEGPLSSKIHAGLDALTTSGSGSSSDRIASLRTPLPAAAKDPRLLAPNTYYLGQGTSLR